MRPMQPMQPHAAHLVQGQGLGGAEPQPAPVPCPPPPSSAPQLAPAGSERGAVTHPEKIKGRAKGWGDNMQ